MIVSLPGSWVDGFIFCHMLRYLDDLFCGVFCVGFCDEGVTRGVGRGVLFPPILTLIAFPLFVLSAIITISFWVHAVLEGVYSSYREQGWGQLIPY